MRVAANSSVVPTKSLNSPVTQRNPRIQALVRSVQITLRIVYPLFPLMAGLVIGLCICHSHAKSPRWTIHPLTLGILWIATRIVHTFTTIFCKELSSLSHEAAYQKVFTDTGHQDTVLIIRATTCWNGAIATRTKEELHILQHLSKTYLLVEKKVSEVHEINQALDRLISQGKRIRLLWLSAHGNPNEITLKSKVSGRELADTIQFERLTQDATILLDSCGAGKSGSRLNIAERICLAAGRHRKVFASKIESSSDMLQLLDNGKRTFAFYYRGRNETFEPSYDTCKAKLKAAVKQAALRHSATSGSC